MNVHFLTSAVDDNVPVKVSADYDGPVPAETCDYLCNRIIGCAKDGFCYPATPIDVYYDIWSRIEQTARNLPSLKSAVATTYLHKAVDNALRKYFKRRIQPLRDEYRATEGRISKADDEESAKAQLDAPEGKDVGYATCASAAESYDYAKGAATSHPLTAQQLSTKLPGEAWARERRQKAAAALEELYAALLKDGFKLAVCAFRAYVRADGNMVEAAHLTGVPRATYYRNWNTWLAQARKELSK